MSPRAAGERPAPSRSRCPAFLVLALVASAAGPPPAVPAHAHGASKGLHLHVRPDPAARGAFVRVRVDASVALTSLRVGFAGAIPTDVAPRTARHRFVLRLQVPPTAGETASLHAEGRAAGGTTYRAAAVVGITGSSPRRSARREDGVPF